MIHNKYVTFFFLEDNDPISADQILSLNLVDNFILLNFLISVLCHSKASCSFTLTTDPVFL